MKKKFLSLVLACILGVMSVSSPVYADEVSTEYSFPDVPEGYLGMIVDEYGNITELIPMPTARINPYVDSIYTIEPKHSFISYQYEPTNQFIVGFGYLTADSYGAEIHATTENRMLELAICKADSISGNRIPVESHIFSTNYEDRFQYLDSYLDNLTETYINLILYGDLSKDYYSGRVTNLSSQSADVRILIYSN